MSNIPDPILQGLQRGWKVLGGKHGALPERLSCDVAIIGSGAGAGIHADDSAYQAAGAEIVRVGSDEVLGTTPFQQEREASPGSEQLKLRLAGYQESLITVPLGRDVSVDRSLTALPKPAEPTPPTAAKPAAAPPKKPIAKRPVAKPKAGK